MQLIVQVRRHRPPMPAYACGHAELGRASNRRLRVAESARYLAVDGPCLEHFR